MLGKYLFILIILLGAVLRFYNLGTASFWYDEICSIDQATRSLSSLFFGFQHDPPFYHLLLKYWIKLFGISEFAVRMLSYIFSVISLYLAYRVGEIIFNKKIAIIATLLLALSPFHIFYSQEARYYMLSFFLVLLSVYIFLKILITNRKRDYYFICIINTIGLYTNPLSLCIIIVESIIFLFTRRSVYKKLWIVSQLVSLIIFLFWAVPALYSISMDYAFFKIRIEDAQMTLNLQGAVSLFKLLIDTFETFIFGGFRYGGSDYYLVVGANEYVHRFLIIWIQLTYLFLLPYLIIAFLRKYYKSEYFYLLLLWLIVPPIIALSCFRIYLPRYFLICLLPFYLLTALAIDGMGLFKKFILIIIIYSLLSPLSLYYTRPIKTNWKDSISYLDDNIKDNDTVVISPSRQMLLLGYYSKYGMKYSKVTRNRIEPHLRQSRAMNIGPYVTKEKNNYFVGINDVEQLKLLAKEEPDVLFRIDKNDLWVIVTKWATPIQELKLRCYLRQFFNFKERHNFTGVFVDHYTPL